jgi:hypothetical protein
MRRFRLPIFGLFEPIGLFDYLRAIDELKEMTRLAAAKAAQKTHGDPGDGRIAPAQPKPAPEAANERE